MVGAGKRKSGWFYFHMATGAVARAPFTPEINNALAAITGLWDNFPSKLWLFWIKVDGCLFAHFFYFKEDRLWLISNWTGSKR